MGPALPLIAALAQAATLNTELGLRTEGRGTALEATDLGTARRTQAFVAPLATFTGATSGILFAGSYAPRLWSSDLKERRSPLVSHAGDLRIDYRDTDRAWVLWVAGAGIRSQTDPLADPWQAAAPAAGTQVATARSLGYQDYRATVGSQLSLSSRTAFEAGAQYYRSQVLNASDGALLPPQQTLSLELALRHLVTERDTLRVNSRSMQVHTTVQEEIAPSAGAPGRVVAGPSVNSELSSTMATWIRTLAPTRTGWLGAGATLTRTVGGADPDPLSFQPAAEAGIRDASETQPVDYSVITRLWTFVDRFEGRLRPMTSASANLGWRPSSRFTLRATASAGVRLDGATRLASADARVMRVLAEGLTLETGIGGSLQEDTRPTLPSYTQGSAFAGLAYRPRQRFLVEVGAVGRRHLERGIAPSFSEGAVFLGVSYATGGIFLMGNAPANAPGLEGEPPPSAPPGPGGEGERG